MGAVGNLLKLAFASEDSFGRVLTGATRRGARTLWSESTGSGLKKVGSFINNSSDEVLAFDKTMKLASDVFDSRTLKAVRKSSKTYKEYFNKITDLFKAGNPDEAAIKKFLSQNGIESVKSKGFIKNAWAKLTGKTIATSSADDITKVAVEKLAVNGTKQASKAKGLFKALKGKGGTVAILLNIAFEIPAIIQGFKNGDGFKQIGRSALNMGGFAAGAAIGAAIGSVIPVAGTVIGGIVGGLSGIIGSMLGGAVTKKIGDSLFGKSIQEQKEEVAEVQEEAIKKQYAAQSASKLNAMA